MSSLGRRINEYRRQRNITQEQLAEAMGVTSQSVSKWENDISCPDISIMPQLADYFNVTLDKLLRGEEASVGKVQFVQNRPQKDFDAMVLRIIVDSADGDHVKVNLPLALVRAGLQLGLPFMKMSMGNNAAASAMDQIDFEQVIQLVESGLVGNIVEVRSADGDTVNIFVE